MNEQVTTKMKIYISGKIGTDTITPEIRDKFNEAAAFFEQQGHEVVNPIDPLHQERGAVYQSQSIPDIYTRRLLYDLSIIATCDAVFLLPDWRDSPGAKTEASFAAAINKKVVAQRNGLFELYDAWKVNPPCNPDTGCPTSCPYFEECNGPAEADDSDE